VSSAPSRKRGPFKATVRALSWEASFALAYEAWVGPATLIVLAGTLGVPIWLVSLLSAIPWLGNLGQVLTLRWYARAPSLKEGTLAWVRIARVLWLIPLLSGVLSWAVTRTLGRAFPVQAWFLGVVVVGILSSISINSATQLWLAWVRGVLPLRVRGRVLGIRQRFVFGSVILAHLISSSIIGWKVSGLYLGVVALSVLTLLSGLLSYRILRTVPDVSPLQSSLSKAVNQDALRVLTVPWKSQAFRSILLSGGSFNFALQFGGPYFIYYFTHELKIPMGKVTAWSAAASAGSLIASAFWGRWTDRSERLDRLFTMTGAFFVVSPLFYLIPARWIPAMAPWEYFINGFGWAGYTLILTSLLMSRCRDAEPGWEPLYFSVFAAFNGFCGAAGALLGGRVLAWLSGTFAFGYDGYAQHWILTSGLRALAVFGVFRLLRPLPIRGNQAMPAPHDH
jgi:hypothetical protein